MAGEPPPRRRFVEFELTGGRLLILAGVAAAALLAVLGLRSCARDRAEAGARLGPDVPAPVENIDARATIFDREGTAGAAPAPGRQVTGSGAVAGQFELDLGAAPTRADAERIAALARSTGVQAGAVRQASGAYRVVAGPFKSEAEARQHASRLSAMLKRDVRVR